MSDAPPTTKPKFTAPAKRGFGLVLTELRADTDYAILDPKAPWIRRLKGKAKKDALASLRFMLYHAEQSGATRPDFYPAKEIVPVDDPNQLPLLNVKPSKFGDMTIGDCLKRIERKKGVASA